MRPVQFGLNGWAMPRRAAKVDANHAEIVKDLRRYGFDVYDMSRVGQGFPDLLVCAHKKWILLEVKDGAKSPSERRLTEAQERFHKACKGPLAVVLSRDDAIQACEAMRG
jgi:hypothetical protein